MSGGDKTTTQTQTSQPWDASQPYLREALQGAQNAYQSGTGFDAYPGSTVVPFSNQTTNALSGIENIARGRGGSGSAGAVGSPGNPFIMEIPRPMPGESDGYTSGTSKPLANGGAGLDPLNDAAMNQTLGVLNSGGMSDWQKGALGKTYDTATGANNIGTEGDYRGLLDQASNPYYQQVVDREAGKLTDDVNRGFSNSGRYGSAAHTGALTDQVGGFRASMANANYNQGIANQQGILGDITGVRGGDIANQVGAGSQINAAGNQATQNVGQFAQMSPQLYQQQYAPYERMASVGSQYEDLATRTMNDQIGRFNTNQQAPWNSLAAYNAIASGAGQLGGTNVGTSTAPANYAAPFGGALGGAQIGSSIMPGWGTALGALGGGALGFLGM